MVISAVLLYFSLQKLNFTEAWQALKTAKYLWLIPGIAVYFVAVWVRAWRWHYLLRPLKKISTRSMFPIVTIGYMGNNIYPARAGEILRAVILKRHEGVPISASLATILVERVFDAVVMLAFIFLNLGELSKMTSSSGYLGNIRDLAIYGAVIAIVVLLIFLAAAMLPHQTRRIVDWINAHFVPVKLRSKVEGLAYRFSGWTGIPTLPSRCLDDPLYIVCDLAARDYKVLVCNACISLCSLFLCPDVEQWDQ